MAASFDLVLRDPKLIRARVRRRGGDGAPPRWPALWLEGSVHEYLMIRDPPTTGTPRGKLLVLAEERQVVVPARGAARVGFGVRRAWMSGLEAVAAVEGTSLRGLLEKDEHAFAVNMLVLVHDRRAGKARPRPSLEESRRRHEHLIAELTLDASGKNLPIAWHALWRLPPAMTWSDTGSDPWMRYPAVSLAVAVRTLRSAEAGADS